MKQGTAAKDLPHIYHHLSPDITKEYAVPRDVYSFYSIEKYSLEPHSKTFLRACSVWTHFGVSIVCAVKMPVCSLSVDTITRQTCSGPSTLSLYKTKRNHFAFESENFLINFTRVYQSRSNK